MLIICHCRTKAKRAGYGGRSKIGSSHFTRRGSSTARIRTERDLSHADGYAGFEFRALSQRQARMCMRLPAWRIRHCVRRKFVDALARTKRKAPPCWEQKRRVIRRIARPYAVEKEARGQPPDKRRPDPVSGQGDEPILDDLLRSMAAARRNFQRYPARRRSQAMRSAIRQDALTRIKRLRPYLDHGILELDTDVVEQPLSQIFWVFGGFSRHASTIFA